MISYIQNADNLTKIILTLGLLILAAYLIHKRVVEAFKRGYITGHKDGVAFVIGYIEEMKDGDE